jgi:hypothetical protein
MWESCRRYPDPVTVARCSAETLDTSRLVTVAVAHGLGPLVWRALVRAGATGALGDRGSALELLAFMGRVEETTVVPRALALAVVPLTDAGFEPVVMKGPWLAARYADPGLRPMVDIDLLLPRRQHRDALRVLGRSGWDVVRPSAVDRYDTMLSHPDVPTLPIELHHRLETPLKRVTAVDADDLWDRRIAVDCLGTPVFALPAAEELVMLAQHAGKPYHGFSRLIWIADLGVVVGRCEDEGPGVEWEAVGRLARAYRCTTVVATALAMARHIGVSAPEELFPVPTRGWRGATIARVVHPSWPLHCDGDALFDLQFALPDLRRSRWALLVGSRHMLSEDPAFRWARDVPVESVARAWRLMSHVRAARATPVGDGHGGGERRPRSPFRRPSQRAPTLERGSGDRALSPVSGGQDPGTHRREASPVSRA